MHINFGLMKKWSKQKDSIIDIIGNWQKLLDLKLLRNVCFQVLLFMQTFKIFK